MAALLNELRTVIQIKKKNRHVFIEDWERMKIFNVNGWPKKKKY